MSSIRAFSLIEATQALPEVERIIARLRELQSSALSREARLEQLWSRLDAGDPVVDEITALQESLESQIHELSTLIEQLTTRGCVLRDLDAGLVDFPAFAGGVPIFLCWRVGEEGIQYWHSREEGFAGRKPLWKMPGTGPNYA